MDQSELIKQCLEKDNGAWREFVRRYEGLIARSVKYKLNRLNTRLPSSEFRDIVQEIFLGIWEKNKLSGLRDPRCLEKWLIMLSVNTTRNYCKKKTTYAASTSLSLNDPVSFASEKSPPILDILEEKSGDLGKLIASKELMAVINRAIDNLKPRQKLVFKLYFIDNVKQKDIAGIMNIPENSVCTLIRRAKSNVKEGVKDYLK